MIEQVKEFSFLERDLKIKPEEKRRRENTFYHVDDFVKNFLKTT